VYLSSKRAEVREVRGAVTLPLTDAQLRLAVLAEITGQRMCAPILFRLPPGAVATVDLDDVLTAIATGNPAFSYRTDIAAEVPVQRWQDTGCDFAEWHTSCIDSAHRLVAKAVDEFEESSDGENMSARVIRSPEGDLLLLMFDHTVVDEESLTIVKRQLDDPPQPKAGSTDLPWQRYGAAIRDRVRSETEAARGAGVAFWKVRLESVNEHLPRRSPAPLKVDAVRRPPRLAIPDGIRGSVYPLVLAAFHRAVREVDELGATVVGYGWGHRNPKFADVLGCFLNTILSIDTTGDWDGVGDSLNEFLVGWRREIDHADVPFSAVTAAGATLPGRPWTGQFDHILVFEHAPAVPRWAVAGVPIQEVEPDYAVPNAPVAAAVVIANGEVRFRIVGAGDISGERLEQLGERWRYWLSEILSHRKDR
jgi:hypothetical protein